MKSEILSRFPWPWLPSLALLFFFCFFIGMVLGLYTSTRKQSLRQAERLPLEDAEPVRTLLKETV